MLQAVILAGGEARRMRPYTEDRPKAMVEVAGEPILAHQLRWLAANNVGDVVLSVGYRAELIQEYVGDGSRFGLEVAYAVEDEPLGRGGGLKLAARRLPRRDERWLAFNGDVIADFSLADLVAKHDKLGVTATVALAPYQTSWGVAELEGDLIKGFVQSPRLPYWINAGIYFMEPGILGMLPDKGDHEDSTFPQLAEQRKLGAYFIEGYWRGIDTAKDVREADTELRRLKKR